MDLFAFSCRFPGLDDAQKMARQNYHFCGLIWIIKSYISVRLRIFIGANGPGE